MTPALSAPRARGEILAPWGRRVIAALSGLKEMSALLGLPARRETKAIRANAALLGSRGP